MSYGGYTFFLASDNRDVSSLISRTIFGSSGQCNLGKLRFCWRGMLGLALVGI